ncbi:fungal trichothecene efflux pump [Exophiala viscosa]|uniref:Fungal trichothecene efflux pump n=1 Tax=Exophiala viscosa TaxID=2486360 RepID=A0AAN6DX58_9EURO|nr:fungal trichothecene efflux pump [Exophiala viscosa]KAI1626168.1 fungal trichothecene efflux pump [Exophiala viscosa]
MASEEGPITNLQRLELEHAQHDQGTIEDYQVSRTLTTDQSRFDFKYLLRLTSAISSITMGTLASYWGFSPPAAILTYISEDLGGAENASLFSIVWTAACAVAIILFGRLSDKFGRRYFMIGASVIGIIGGIIACTAKSMNTLIGANVLLGLAGGVMTCYGLTVGEICPNRWKLLGITICVIPNILPTGFGAYLSLRLVETGAGWRWCYYSYLMMMGLALLLQILFYHPPSFQQLHGGKRTVMQEVKRIDFVGIFLMVAGLSMFLLGISWGGSPLPWTSARILCLVILGGVTLIAFVLYEIFSGVPNPLVPMYFFKDVRGFDCLVVICGVSGISYVAPSIIWPSQVASIYGLNATSWQENAWLSTTIAFGIIGGIYIWGPLFAIIKHVKWQVVVLAIMVLTFSGALASSNQHNRGQSAAFSFLTTFPGGILELIPVSLVQMEANDADLGTVFAILFLVRTTLGSIFATIYIAILDNKLPTEILAKVPAAALAAGLPKSSLTALLTATATGTAAALKAVPGMTTEIQAVVTNALLDARASAYSYIYYASIAVNLCAVIAALCLRGYDHLLTSHVPRQIYNHGKGADTAQAQAADIEQATEKGAREEDTDKKLWREVETTPSE